MSVYGCDETSLHLPDLAITGFRGIDRLSIPRLARVTLLAGKNGAGKTTILDAVRAYAAPRHISTLRDILHGREEISNYIDDEGERRFETDWAALFFGREIEINPKISISSTSGSLKIEVENMSKVIVENEELFPESLDSQDSKVIAVRNGNIEEFIPFAITPSASGISPDTIRRLRRLPSGIPSTNRPMGLKCESLGPGLLSDRDIGAFWDRVALTDAEEKAVEALRTVLGEEVEKVAVVGDTRSVRRVGRHMFVDRRALVKMKNYEKPVPLKSLGDGAARLFGVALALANCADGFLLIDEAENGLHWSVERDFWRMVLGTARENNVQVLATTHGWDCVVGFAQAVNETPEEDGLLLRLEREEGRTTVVNYTEQDLAIAAEQRIEVR